MTKPKILHIGLCVNPSGIVNDMQRAFVNNSSEYREISTGDPQVNSGACRISNEFKPDIIFMQIQAERIIAPSTVELFKNNGAFVINWTGDVRDSVPNWMYSLPVDVTAFSNLRDVKEVQERGLKSAYLEIGYDPNIYKPEGEAKNIEPIVFFGNSYGPSMFPMSEFRIKMCTHLKSIFAGRFGIYGTGWNISSGNFNSSQPEEASAYRGAKIAINCSHYEIEKYSSDRLFRILGTGKAICLAKWYPRIEEDFEDGVHLRYWKTIDELKDLINYYLDPANEQERVSIALQGHILAKEKFTFNNMAENVIKIWEVMK